MGLCLISALWGGMCWSCSCLTRGAWHQNLVHYMGLSVRTEVQPIAVPKDQEEWDKNTKKPPQFGLTSTQLICAACGIWGNNRKTEPFFLITGFLTPIRLFTLLQRSVVHRDEVSRWELVLVTPRLGFNPCMGLSLQSWTWWSLWVPSSSEHSVISSDFQQLVLTS